MVIYMRNFFSIGEISDLLGIPKSTLRYWESEGLIDRQRDDINNYKTDNFLHMIFSQSLKYTPGTQYVYTDVPHYILSRVITKITGLKADEFILFNILNPLKFNPVAWLRCPLGFTIGATGLYTRASDMVKLAWMYLNNGLYDGKEIVSSQWVKSSVERGYEIRRIGDTHFWGKGGMNGQMLMYAPEHRFAIAWHTFEQTGRDKLIMDFCKDVL
jgi:CubicO group peptidase (beta-lactamase class C family)